MKLDKAYDYFSAYYEGSLDSSLRAQMDRLFEANPRLRQDFEAFAGALQDLESTRQFEIEVPADLHERIISRLDRSIYEAARAKPSGFMGFWRRYAIGAVAVVLIAGGALSVVNRGSSKEVQASPIPTSLNNQVDSEPHVDGNARGTFLRFKPTREDSVKIMRLPDGKVLQTYTVNPNQELDVPLQNPAEEAIVLVISSANSKNALTVVVPGSAKSEEKSGEGTMLDFARAMSAHYQMPVMLDTEKRDAMIRWTLNAENMTQPTLSPSEISVELKDMLIRIRY